MAKHIVKNFSSLAKTKLRQDALMILESGLAAIDTGDIIRKTVRISGKKLAIAGRTYDLGRYDHLYVIGFGKSSLAAGQALEKILGRRISGGIILDVKGGGLKRLKSLTGTHPLPSLQNVRAAGEIMKILEKADSNDLIITVVSGGGSTLLCRPYGIKCGELALVTKMLMRRGADIQEMNTVRKHLSEILGGQFARLAYPATVVGLIFSDVPGDELGMVASGPTVMDKSTAKAAAAILAKYRILKACSLPSCDLRETRKDKIYFRKVWNVLVVNNVVAVKAMKETAVKLGYRARVFTTELAGEARDAGRALAILPRPGEAVIAAGETTVTVTGKGAGGRNQELVLGALEYAGPDGLILSCASDGIDNSPAAGAIGDHVTCERTRQLKLSPYRYLADNDSFAFMKKTGSQILTDKTGANVSDLMVAMRAKKRK